MVVTNEKPKCPYAVISWYDRKTIMCMLYHSQCELLQGMDNPTIYAQCVFLGLVPKYIGKYKEPNT
mgnify:CR=1 FL=1